MRLIEVKGRAGGSDTVTVSRNKILTALNRAEVFILVLMEVESGIARESRYVRAPDFRASSVTYKLGELLARAEAPQHMVVESVTDRLGPTFARSKIANGC